MSLYVTDTHPLVWYATGEHRQLSRKALRAFNAASQEEALIYVPAFVLWEIAVLLKVGVLLWTKITAIGPSASWRNAG